MDDFELELKNGFLEESIQLLSETEQCFLSLESSPGDPSILEKIFRLAHNLKGSSKAVGFDELSHFTHEWESYLLKLKNKQIEISPSSVDLLLRCNDHVSKIVHALKDDMNAKIDSSALLAEIERHMSGAAAPIAAPAAPAAEAPPTAAAEAHAEEEAPKAAEEEAHEEVHTMPEAKKAPVAAKKPPADESIRVSLSRVEKLLNFVGEMVILQTVLQEQSQGTNSLLLRKTVHQIGKVTKEVQDISMSLRMVPLKQTFQKMTRIVRDTSAALNKKVQLELEGEETEVDKTILENLSDPLVHLIRNAVDHGVESADLRSAAGKSEVGLVKLGARHESGNLIIEVRDDGAGLDPEKLRKKAIEKGIIKPDTVLSDKDAYQLIFASGFSTKAVVTDVSGRGVGMDVVKTNIEQLQGSIQIESEIGKGTRFRVCLPLTLAIIDGMVVQLEKERFVVPLSHVHESVRPSKSDLHTTGLGDIFLLRGESIPIFRLGSMLGKKNAGKPAWDSIAIVVRMQSAVFAVLVDDILGQQQVVIKQLAQEFQGMKGFSGSAILGDGRPALILELNELAMKIKASNKKITETRRAAV